MKRILQYFGFLLSWSGVILQYYLSMTVADSRVSETIRFLSFMTIWTNIIVALFFTSQITASDNRLGRIFSKPSVQAALLVYIIIVGLIYHLFLAKQWNPQGWEFIADQILHTAVPLFYFVVWLFFADKQRMKLTTAFSWLSYPVAYIFYTLIRGAIIGKYPYFFIDVTKLGYGMTFRNIGLIAAAYVILGVVVILLNNLLRRNHGSAELGTKD